MVEASPEVAPGATGARGEAGAAPGPQDGAAAAAEALEVGYRRLRESVALLDLSDRGVVHLAGPEGQDFLQGLVTSDVARLRDGRGCAAAVLTPLGKVFAVADVYRAAPDALYLLLQAGGGEGLAEFLERYHFNELVEIADLTAEMAWLSLQGPVAPAAAETVCGEGSVPEPHGFRTLSFGGRTLRVARRDEVGAPALHFLVHRSAAPALRAALEGAAAAAGGGTATLEAWTARRVELGVPWHGAELDESVLPMEAGLRHVIDQAKGCYIGQEVVARALVQGRTNWSLWGLRLPAGSRVAPRQELRGAARPRPVVRVRSVAHPPGAPGPLALAFVHRAVARPGPLVLRPVPREDGGHGGEAAGEEIEIELVELPFDRSGTPPAGVS